LSESLEGPWLTPEDRSVFGTSWRTVFYPTIRHRPKLALKSAKHVLPPEEPIRKLRFPQGALLLRRDYGKLLDTHLLKIDPFYAMHELFSFTASSELQFLNLIDNKLGPETGYAILSQKTPSLSNLLYTQEILQAHIEHLYENIETIKRKGSPDWPKTPENSELSKIADAAASLLLRDFEFLLAKAETLSKRCERGTSVIMNNANIAESRRAMTQARRVGKLTLLAFFYVPLSFTASFFGMNLEQFGTSTTIGIWVWFAVSAPVLLLSVLFYVWDIPAFVGRLSLYKRMKQWWRNMY
jgi:CorA-like Mg2+ transporter protein